LFALFKIGVGEDAIVERPDFIHDGLEAALSDEFQERAEFILRSHVGTEDGELAGEEEAEVDLRVIAGGTTASHKAAADGKAFHAFVPGGCANVLEDDVHAVIVGDAANFLGDGHDAVMNDFVSADVLGFFEFFVAASSGDDMSAEEFGNLDGSAADAAAGSENENGFTRTKLSASDEHVPCGHENERDSGGVNPIEVFGIRHAVDFGTTDVFGTAAINHEAEVGEVAAEIIVAGKTGGAAATGDARGENDFVADVDAVDFTADLDDFSGDVTAGDVRKRDGNAG